MKTPSSPYTETSLKPYLPIVPSNSPNSVLSQVALLNKLSPKCTVLSVYGKCEPEISKKRVAG